MKKWLIILIVIFAPFILKSQVDLSLSFEQDTIVIGDEVNMRLSIEADQDVQVLAVTKYFVDSVYGALQSMKAYTDTTQDIQPVLADFELTSLNGWEDANDDGLFGLDEMAWQESTIGSKSLKEHNFTFKFWDPGDNVIVYPVIVYSKDGVQDTYVEQNQVSVFVSPPGGLTAVQDSIDIAPIKTIQEEKANLSDFIFYIILIVVALLLGLGYWLYIRYLKRKEQLEVLEEEQKIEIPAHEIALDKLTELRNKELWQKGEIKSYQSELTHIIREYLEGRYDIAALESTTDEIVRDLMKESVDQGNIISVKRILQVADLVKFAKAIPEANIHETFMNEAESLVSDTADEEKTVEVKLNKE